MALEQRTAAPSPKAPPPSESKPLNVASSAEGVNDVIGMLFAAPDAIGSAIPGIGEEEEFREIGDLERNTPPARPGYVQMWIRGWYADDKPDTKNLNRMQRDGWRPRVPNPAESATYSVLSHGGMSIISVNNMILMERSEELDERAKRINRQRIAQQSMGANLDEEGRFDSKYARLFGSVSTRSKVGRDAADLVD